MSRILSIFRKDARHLWPHIAVFLTLLAAAALLDPTYTTSDVSAYSLLSSLLPLACWSIVITVIHQEKLTGHRQYWVTRPIPGKVLLTSKALFIAAFVNIPILCCHIAVLAAMGIPVLPYLPALLWRQVFFTAFYILPVAALASITRNIGQIILTVIACALPVVAQGFLFARFRIRWGDAGWMMTAAVALILTIGIAAVLVIQYSRRHTALARLAAAAVALATLGVTFLPARGSSPSGSVRISLDSRRGRPATFQPNGRETVAVEIPVRVEGIPAGADLVKDRMTLSFRSPEGRALRASWSEGGLHELVNGEGWFSALVDRNIFLALKDTAVNVSGTVDFTVFEQSEVLPLPKDRSVIVPRIGVCTHSPDIGGPMSIVCLTPFPRASLYLGKPGRGANWILPRGFVGPPIPTAAGFQPLTRFSTQLPFATWDEVADAQLIAGRPLAHLSVPFQFAGIKLQDFARR